MAKWRPRAHQDKAPSDPTGVITITMKLLERRRKLISLLKKKFQQGELNDSEEGQIRSLASKMLCDRQDLKAQGIDPEIALRAARSREAKMEVLAKKKRKRRKKRKIRGSFSAKPKSGGVGMYSIGRSPRRWKI